MKIIHKTIICLLLMAASAFTVQAQVKEDSARLARYLLDSINGVYIPRDLDDAFKQIDSFWSDSLQQEVKSMPEKEFAGQAHFGIGMWMRNNWGLWMGSRLSKYFNDLGIFHPDDMSGIITRSYHRYLTGEERRLSEQISYYQEYWRRMKEKEKSASE